MKTKIKTMQWMVVTVLTGVFFMTLSSFTAKAPSIIEEEEFANVKVEVRNYSDWDIRIRRKADNGFTNRNIVKSNGKGSKYFSGATTLVVQWKDGLKWRKYNEYKVTGSTMCIEASGKVMELRGIKIISCR